MSLTREEMLGYVLENIENEPKDTLTKDCDTLEYLFDNCTITIPMENRFFCSVNTADITWDIRRVRAKKFSSIIKDNHLEDGFEALAYTGAYDYSHTITEWDNLLAFGFRGMRDRVAEYSKNNPSKQAFYSNIIRVYNAALRFIKRAAKEASIAGKKEMATGLENLSEKAPETLFEAMQLTIVYYVLQNLFDGTFVRTLGRLDSLLYPFYIKEDKENADKLLVDYLREIDRLKALSNIPFALGGTDISGKSLINELSYKILEAYEKAEINNTKIHLLCSGNMPVGIIKKALDSVRNGNNSIVFMSDEKVIESLMKQGAEKADAVDYHVVGCYECGARGELTCSCNARVNIPKALEYTLNGGRDLITGKTIGLENSGEFNSFEELYVEFKRQLNYLCSCAMKATDLWEAHYAEIHSAPILSGTYVSALEKGGDLYCDYAAKYNNSSVNAIGLATATDSLAAIEKAVFKDKLLSLEEFCRILRSNWDGAEPLHQLIKNKFPKFGQGDTATDKIAADIVKNLADTVSRKPNVKGGVYRLGLFSIDWRWAFGEKTAASADGRLSGETLSQNTSASFGADKNGATAILTSVSAIDASDTPNATIVDIDLHSSAVSGENGLNAMLASLKTYFEMGGFAVQYNVLNTEVLKDAKLNPEKYPNLQVRLCGWNVLFSSLSEKEKDEFIARSVK